MASSEVLEAFPLTLSPILISTKKPFPADFWVSTIHVLLSVSLWHYPESFRKFWIGQIVIFVRNAIPSDLQSRDYKSHQSRERQTLSNAGK